MPQPNSFMHTAREGDGSSTSAGKDLPAGVSRAAALKELLDKHEEPVDPTEHVPAHRFWAKRLGRTLGLAAVVMVCSFRADAQEARTVIVNKGTMTSSTPRLSPQAAADVLRPHQYVAPPTCERCDGPYIVSTGSTPGALYWMAPPPEAPRRRLDGTLIDSRPPDSFWSTPVLTAPHRRR